MTLGVEKEGPATASCLVTNNCFQGPKMKVPGHFMVNFGGAIYMVRI